MNATIETIPPEARVIGPRLQEALGAEQVHLFGSHARGSAVPIVTSIFLSWWRNQLEPGINALLKPVTPSMGINSRATSSFSRALSGSGN